MGVANRVNRFVERVGSLMPFNQGRFYDEIDQQEQEKADTKLLVSLLQRNEWAYLRYELQQRIKALEDRGFEFMADPRKFELQAVDCAARRHELLQLIDIIENSPEKLEKIEIRLKELYEITRDWPSMPRQAMTRASNEGNQ